MDGLLAQYPDAALVEIHRDPAKIMPSVAYLYQANRVLHSDEVDPKEVGRDVVSIYSEGARRLRDFRARRPEVRVIDLTYEELIADPIGATGALYERMGRTRTPQGTAAARRALAENARDKRPQHRYELEDFGLSQQDITEHFGTFEPMSSL
jgi:hypothetical protein